MEDSEKKNELWKEINEKIDVDQDKVITLFILKNKNKSCLIDRLIGELNLLSFEDHLCQKYADLNVSNEERYHDQDKEIVWQNLTDDDNYEELLRNFSECSSLSSEMLDRLLKIHLLDSRQSYWEDLSKKLQECFSSIDHDMFLKSLKIHHKMIMTQNCCIDGYLSLLRASHRIIKGEFLEKFEDGNLELNNRVLSCIKIILSTELFMLNNLHNGYDKKIADILENLMELIGFETNIQNKQTVILYSVSILDEKAEWFKYLCLSGFTKPLISKTLEKYPTILKLVFKTFFYPLNDKLYSLTSNLNKNIHTHSCYFLAYYFSIQENIRGFELNIFENKTYNFLELLSLIIHTVNNNVSSEIREILKNFILLLFEMNPSLINQEVLEILFIPFENIMKENSLRVISNNVYLFKLIKLSVKNNDKILTDRYLYNRRKYKGIFNFGQSARNITSANIKSVNIPQLIIDITILMMRNYINTSEKMQSVDDNTLLLLECCNNIYFSHPVFLYNALTSKFIINLSSFYKALNNFHTTRLEIGIVLNIFSFFFKYHVNILKLFKDKIFVLNILNYIISTKIDVGSCMIFNNFSNEIFLEDELQTQLHLVTQTFLLSAWSQENGDENIETILDKESFIELLHFLYGISHSIKLIQILVTRCHNLDIMRNGMMPIPTLLKISNQNVRNTIETYTGLLFMRICMSNLDGLLLLQTTFDLRDNLAKVLSQVDCHSESKDVTYLPDACTIIRKNLMMHIDYVGHPNKALNKFGDSIRSPILSGSKIWNIKSGRNCDLQKFLHNTKAAVHDHSWKYQVKSFFYKFCSEGYKASVVYEIISQCPKNMQERISRTWPESGKLLPQLYKEDLVAISIIVKFGMQNQLLTTGYRHEENLALLVKQSRVFLDEQCEEFVGFDWFIGVCFLVCSGNIERCKNLCVNISHLPSVNLIWYKYGRAFGSLWLENFFQHLEVLMAENTILYSALMMGHMNPKMVMEKWLSQCFFNILDFREICNLIIFSVLSPLECSMYYMLCLFIHSRSSICKITHTPCLDNLLNVFSLDDFKLTSYLPTINDLAARYRNIIKL